VVVGGGNSAVEEALYLSHIAADVTVVHRRDSFRAERAMVERLLARPNVAVRWMSVVEDILGDEEPRDVTHVRLKNVETGVFEELATGGVFVAIGHAPATELVSGQVDLKPNGYVRTAPGSTATSVEGVYQWFSLPDGASECVYLNAVPLNDNENAAPIEHAA